MCDVDLSEELEDMKNLLNEKLSRETPIWEGKFNCLVYAMEKFLESNRRFLNIQEKIDSLEEKMELIKEIADEDC